MPNLPFGITTLTYRRDIFVIIHEVIESTAVSVCVQCATKGALETPKKDRFSKAVALCTRGNNNGTYQSCVNSLWDFFLLL